MSKCNVIGDPAEIYNGLAAGIAPFSFDNNYTREDSLYSMEYLEQQKVAGAIERREFINEAGESILKYVWHLNGKEFIFHKSPSMFSKAMWEKNNKNAVTDKFGMYTLIAGNTMHYAFEQLMSKRAGIDTNITKKELLNSINSDPEKIQIDLSVLNDIERRVNEIYTQAAEHQKRIDSNAEMVVKLESLIVHPRKSLMGTQDLMFVFSDNTAWDFDYKSTILTNDKLNANSEPKNPIESFTKTVSHSAQMLAYAEAKIEVHKIKAVTRSEIVPLGLIVQGMSSRGKFKATKPSDLKITRLFSDDKDYRTARVASTLYKSHIESLSKELQKQSFLLKELVKNKKEAVTERDFKQVERYNEALRQLSKMSQDLLVHSNISSIYTTILNLLQILPDNLYQPATIDVNGEIQMNPKAVSNQELLMIEKQFEAMLAMKDVLFDMVSDMYNIKSTGNKLTDPLVKKVEELRSELINKSVIPDVDIFEVLSQKHAEIKAFRVKRTQERIGLNKLYNGKIVANSLTAWENYATVYGEIDNAGISALNTLSTIAYQKANRKYSSRSKRFLKFATDAANYGRDIGLSQVEMMDMLVDKESGNMIPMYSQEFDDTRNKAFLDNDITWIQDHHELKDEAVFLNWYEKTLESKLYILRKSAGWDAINGYPSDLIKTDVEKAIYEWQTANDLINSQVAWLNKSTVNKFAVIKNSEKYYTEEYSKITTMQPILEFYHEFAELWTELRGILGQSTTTLPDNFIPNIQAEIIDSFFSAFDLTKFSKEMVAQLQDSVMTNEIDRITMRNDSNNQSFEVPIIGLQPLHKNQSRAVNSKSYDIISSALLFMQMAYTHEQLTDTLPDAEMILNFLADPELTQENVTLGSGRKKQDIFGSKAIKALGLKEASVYNKAKKMFDYNWLGIRFSKAHEYPKIGGTFNPETGEVEGQIDTAKALLLTRDLSIKAALGFNAISAAGANLSSFSRAMVIGRDKLAYNRKDFIQAAKDFANEEERNKMALATAWFNTSSEGVQRKDIFDSKNLAKGDTVKGNFRKWLSAEGLLKFFSGGDAILATIVTSAMLRNFGYDKSVNRIRRLALCPEDTVSLWDSMRVSEEGEITFENTTPTNILSEVDEATFYRAVRFSMHGITGQLNDQELMGLQETILGTMFTTYRTWLPNILQSEFGKPKYVEQLEAMAEGRMNTLWKNYFKDYAEIATDPSIQNSIKNIVKGLFTLSKDVISTAIRLKDLDGSELINNPSALMEYEMWAQDFPEKAQLLGETKEEKLKQWLEMKHRNLIAGIAMIRTISTLMALSALAGSIDLDDNDEADVQEIMFLKTAFRVFNRVANELSTPINLTEILSIGEIKLPAISMFKNMIASFYNLMDESSKSISGEIDKRDKTPYLYYGTRVIPVVNPVYKMLYRALYTNPPKTLDSTPAWERFLMLG